MILFYLSDVLYFALPQEAQMLNVKEVRVNAIEIKSRENFEKSIVL